MNIKDQIEKLRALKEQFAKKQTLLARAKKINERISPTNLSKLLENDLEQAKLILAARDVCDKLQKIAEHLAELGAEEIMPLADSMKGAFGPEAASAFEHAANENIQKSLETVRAAKDSINDAILKVEGKVAPQNDMNSDAPVDPASTAIPNNMAAPEQPAPSSDPFGGADAASGPDDEPLGRAKKEGRINTKTKIDDSVKEGKSYKRDDDDMEDTEKSRKKSKEKRDAVKQKRDGQTANLDGNESFSLTAAGSKLLEKYTLDKLMNMIMVEASQNLSRKEYDRFVSNAVSKAINNPHAMAGWIGKKIFGESEMIKLTKSKETLRSELIAEAIAKMIETNVKIFGKGKAAKVVESFLDNSIMENESKSIFDMFESIYGMKPAEYSIHIARKLHEDPDDLTPADNTNVSGALGQIASKIATNPSLANQPASNVISSLDPNSRTALQKVAGTAGTPGMAPNVGQLVKTASDDLDKNKIAPGMTEAKRGNKGENVDDDVKGVGHPKKLKGTNAKNTIAKESNVSEAKRGNKGEYVDKDIKNAGHPKKLKGTNAKKTITKEELIQLGESKVHKKSTKRHPDYLMGIGAYYGGIPRATIVGGFNGCDTDKASSGWDAACSHDTGSAPSPGAGDSAPADGGDGGGAVSEAAERHHPVGSRVKIGGSGEHSGKEGTITKVRKEPTFSQMVPHVKKHDIKLDSGETIGGKRTGELTRLKSKASEDIDENINAAHWPTDTMGQYKGDPMSTNYGKHKVMMTPMKGDSTKSSDSKESTSDSKKTSDTSRSNDVKEPEVDTEKNNDKNLTPKKKSYEDEVSEAANKKGKIPPQFVKKTKEASSQEKKNVKSPMPHAQPGSKKHKTSDMSKAIK